MKRLLFVLYVSIFVVDAQSASTTATATMNVIAAIAITNASNMVFPNAAVGDPAFILPPGAAENANNASFNITGNPSTPFTIQLPATATMITGAGGANRTILVNAFTSTPATTGTLSAGGTAKLYVGATRAALPATQITGAYTATFTVTVIY
jgi:hypothetical protein